MTPNILFSFPTIFSIFTIFLSSSALSRSLFESNLPTAILDVSASLKQAHEVLSFKPSTDSLYKSNPSNFSSLPSSSSATSFSLVLQPREALQNSKHQDYQSLVVSRLNRDSARVNSLLVKLQLVLDNLNKSDETQLRPEDLSVPIFSGSSQGSGEYFSRVGIGSPSKSFSMVLDTGSDINWLQCQPCPSTKCYEQSDPIFDPKDSSTNKPLTCESQQCKYLQTSGCRGGTCQYQVSYGDGSSSVGDFVTDTVSFGNSGSINDVALGCGHDNEGLFVGAAGLLGLGGGPLSLVSQIKATSFSYCLVDRDSSSTSTLDFNSAPPADSVTAPLLKNRKIDTFYYVELTGMSVGGQPLSISPESFAISESGSGGIIVDSGTAITRLKTQVYESLRDSFKKLTTHLTSKSSDIPLFDTCYDLSSQTTVKVPTLSFQFSGGKSLDIPAHNYLIQVDSSGTFCFAFAPTSSLLSIIGNVQQQGIRVSFDLANSRVGFSPKKC